MLLDTLKLVLLIYFVYLLECCVVLCFVFLKGCLPFSDSHAKDGQEIKQI